MMYINQHTRDETELSSLNVIHLASGPVVSKSPAQWLHPKPVQKLVVGVEKQTVQNCIVSIEGCNGGTFADEQLAQSLSVGGVQ
ncbi:hypothetical protein [Aeromonas jandaei]|uniref:hypothetical protein n=1 Tax=Aeromonas jandaei TaxID=650 RepID=UPI003BA2FE81